MSDEVRRLGTEQALELVHLPAYSPELQPAEHLWELCDEPIVNQVFSNLEALEAALSTQCVRLTREQEKIRSRTLFHWWPGGADHSGTD